MSDYYKDAQKAAFGLMYDQIGDVIDERLCDDVVPIVASAVRRMVKDMTLEQFMILKDEPWQEIPDFDD